MSRAKFVLMAGSGSRGVLQRQTRHEPKSAVLHYPKHLSSRNMLSIFQHEEENWSGAMIMQKCARILFAFSSIADNHSSIYS
jgi:hypothetical protein|uniref:Uncharacterized protein n=1 Tax=Zea mays TaxID=4577 RepID=C0HGS4_MAIZE|nr:unknown [Zea mays]